MVSGFKKRFGQLVAYFIPASHLEDGNVHQASKIRVSIFLITTFMYVLYTPNALGLNLQGLAVVHMVAVFIILVSLFLHRRDWSVEGTAHLYLVGASSGIFAGMVYLGGLLAPAAVFLIPAIAMLVGNKRIAVIWLVISIVFLTIIYMMTNAGYSFEIGYDPALRDYIHYSSVLGIVIVLFLCISVFDNEIKLAIKTILQINEALNVEKEKSENLLLNILPSEIAEELKETGDSKAREYKDVTILFTDFVNFTKISETIGPVETVAELHKQFTLFDQIMEKHGLEKIKTIGDSYMAVCGLPLANENHATNTVAAALDILESLTQNQSKFEVRIGINSGTVVAGIVGVKKYAYDIWGDAVNTASRMEQHSHPGKINISSATYALIKGHFSCVSRGEVEVKNKGKTGMYFVE